MVKLEPETCYLDTDLRDRLHTHRDKEALWLWFYTLYVSSGLFRLVESAINIDVEQIFPMGTLK